MKDNFNDSFLMIVEKDSLEKLDDYDGRCANFRMNL